MLLIEIILVVNSIQLFILQFSHDVLNFGHKFLDDTRLHVDSNVAVFAGIALGCD